MASYILFIILCTILMCFFFFSTEHADAALSQDEFVALKTVASKLGIVDWDFSVDPCISTGFKGLTCDSVSGSHVTNITLPKFNLGGELSPELTKLTYLIGLDLSENGVSGPIPPQLGSMPSLRNLTLSLNLLSGPIPKEMGNLTSLVVLNIHSNHLSGTLPQEIGDLKNLQQLIISSNQLSGTLPSEIGDLRKLNRLSIYSNHFSGTLPPEIGDLENLENLFVSSNQFIGEIPQAFSKLVRLQEFLGSGNNFTGKIPEFLGNFTSLETLMLQGTSMNGPIPSTLSTLKQLKYLRISDITQGGSSLDFILSLNNLRELVLRNNNITAKIPVGIENVLQKLEYLDLSFNNLIGEIPPSLSLLPRLQILFLGNNSFTGTIPYWLSQFQGTVDLSYNSLRGDIPGSLNGENSNVNLIGNFLTDNSSMSCLQRNVSCSERVSRYPLAINCGGPKLKNRVRSLVFDEDDDKLSTTPFHLSTSKNWGVSNIGYYLEYFTAQQKMKAQYVVINNITFNSTIDPHNNTTITSVIDPRLYMTARTAPISLRYYCLGLQNGPYSVELHFAEIQFEDTKASKGVRIFDIYIQGIEATKDFNMKEAAGGKTFVVVKNYTINVTKNILEIHFFWAGKGTCCEPIEGTFGPLVSAIIVAPEFTPHIPKNKTPIKIIIIILAVTVTLGLLLILSLIFIKKTKWHGIFHIVMRDKELKKMKGNSFSLRVIKSATENFDPKNKIGEGGFGAVYKGALAGGTKVAIKQLSSMSRQGNREFLNEVTTISAVKHPNLVKLYGCCVEGDELLLVYEYIENGDLAQALFGTDEARVELDWATRYSICLGVSRGLAYLHQESVIKIVHRDIKPTNILLDKSLNPKIADFGLARLFDEEDTHVNTRIAGTIGYLAPEYALRGHLSDKSDVYSFGVVVLEVISGRKHTDITLEEDRAYLLEWSWHLYEENRVLELVDVKLMQLGFNEEDVIKMIHIGLLCTHVNPNSRPTMSAVVQMMEGSMATPVPQSGPGYLTRLQVWELAAGIFHDQEQSSTTVTSQSSSLTAQWKERS